MDDTTKAFFSDVTATGTLARLIGFENEASIFPGVHHAFKFCALSITGTGRTVNRADFAFLCREFSHVQDPRRHFQLSSEDIALLNPNTRTCSVFRTSTDAELTKAIYRRVPVLVNEATGENPWGIRFGTMFHMSNDSGLFRTEPSPGYVPLYEAKRLHQFDHRWATYAPDGTTRELADDEKKNPDYVVLPRYWVPHSEIESRLRRSPGSIGCSVSDALRAPQTHGHFC